MGGRVSTISNVQVMCAYLVDISSYVFVNSVSGRDCNSGHKCR
jgi:hypothetical protein